MWLKCFRINFHQIDVVISWQKKKQLLNHHIVIRALIISLLLRFYYNFIFSFSFFCFHIHCCHCQMHFSRSLVSWNEWIFSFVFFSALVMTRFDESGKCEWGIAVIVDTTKKQIFFLQFCRRQMDSAFIYF